MATCRVRATLEVTVDATFTIEGFTAAAELQSLIEERLDEIYESLTVIMSDCSCEVTHIEHKGYSFEPEEK